MLVSDVGSFPLEIREVLIENSSYDYVRWYTTRFLSINYLYKKIFIYELPHIIIVDNKHA